MVVATNNVVKEEDMEATTVDTTTTKPESAWLCDEVAVAVPPTWRSLQHHTTALAGTQQHQRRHCREPF